jgi:hypothetical protein
MCFGCHSERVSICTSLSIGVYCAIIGGINEILFCVRALLCPFFCYPNMLFCVHSFAIATYPFSIFYEEDDE